jgi:hypothetical protein
MAPIWNSEGEKHNTNTLLNPPFQSRYMLMLMHWKQNEQNKKYPES